MDLKLGKKCLSIFLTMVLLISMIGVVPAAAQSTVGYVLSGTEDNNEFTLDISIRDVNALVGRVAVSFDPEKLELKDTSSLANAVKKSSDVVLTQEGLDLSVLLSNTEGYAMFAWYSSGNSGLDATAEDKLIASIPFRIKDGYSADDFNRNTFNIRYVNSSMLDNWECGASIIAKGLVKYTNTSSSDEYLCNVTYDYPNCDYVPIVSYEAKIYVRDLYGNPIAGARVEIDDLREETDSNGIAVFSLENGTYGYRILAPGYRTGTGYVIINGSDRQKAVLLKSYAQMVQEIANNLQLEFAAGDDAANVTTGIGLAEIGDDGATITWESSNPDVVTSQGIVIRQQRDVNVVLTATISLEDAVTKRTFNITVRGKGTAEETDTAIVRMDAENLSIGYAPGDSAASVTSDLTLPSAGIYGSGILWESSNPEVIDEYGSVIRQDSDTDIMLTATVMRGKAVETRSFNVTVKAVPKPNTKPSKSDEDIVNEILEILEIGYAEGDSANSVTKAMTLPTDGADGTVIVWKSSQPAIVTGYGGVVRQGKDCPITLTAVISKGSVTREKTFNIIVIAAEEKPVNPNDDPDKPVVTTAPATPTPIPTRAPGGTPVPTAAPTVTPAEPTPSAKPSKSDEECVREDKEALKIIYAPGDKAESVTTAILLPSKGENGSSIFWESSAPEVISTYGVVTRQSADTNVTLTAIVLKGESTATVTFTLTVKGRDTIYSDSDYDIVHEVANSLEIIYSGSDNADRVTSSVILPTVGAQDTAITWKTSDKGVIAVNGTVTRKSTDMEVVLTAIISRGDASVEKEFTLKVPAAEKKSGSSVANTSGSADEEIKIEPSASQAPSATAAPNERFNDLDSVPWAKNAILNLANEGIINGTSDNEFSPQNPIRRGDFVILLVNLLKLDSELGEGFADVSADAYYYKHITIAKTLGVISGIGDNNFNPDGNISRQDMITITYRALDKLGMLDTVEDTDLSSFSDASDVADYAYEAVKYMVGNGMISGDNGKLNPVNNTTRAETAVFLYNLYQNQGR